MALKEIKKTIHGIEYGTKEMSAYDAARLKSNFGNMPSSDIFDNFMTYQIGKAYFVDPESGIKQYFMSLDDIKDHFAKDGNKMEMFLGFIMEDFTNSFLDQEEGESLQP